MDASVFSSLEKTGGVVLSNTLWDENSIFGLSVGLVFSEPPSSNNLWVVPCPC